MATNDQIRIVKNPRTGQSHVRVVGRNGSKVVAGETHPRRGRAVSNLESLAAAFGCSVVKLDAGGVAVRTDGGRVLTVTDVVDAVSD